MPCVCMDKYHMAQSSLCTNELCSALLGKVYDPLVFFGFLFFFQAALKSSSLCWNCVNTLSCHIAQTKQTNFALNLVLPQFRCFTTHQVSGGAQTPQSNQWLITESVLVMSQQSLCELFFELLIQGSLCSTQLPVASAEAETSCCYTFQS